MSKASRIREVSKDTGEGNESHLVHEIENFIEELIQFLRREENIIESDLSNSNKFNSIRVFSKLPAENGKPAQLLAASILLGREELRQEIRGQVRPGLFEKIERYMNTLDSREERYFPSGDASYHTSSDQILFHHLPEEILEEVEISENALESLEPFLEYLFSDLTDMEDLKDSLAHEACHSWLSKNSKKPELDPAEELRAAEESFCYFSGWVKSGIYLEEDHLVESKTPQKKKVAWATQLMIEKAEAENVGIDWARENAKQMYTEVSEDQNPFRFIFKKALTNKEKLMLNRYKNILEHSLQEVFKEFSEMIEDVEETSLSQGKKISYERAKQIESQVRWDEPEKAEQSLRKAVFNECVQNLLSHSDIESVIHREVRKEAQKLSEYMKMVSKLEESLDSGPLIQEAEQVKQDLDQALQKAAAAD